MKYTLAKGLAQHTFTKHLPFSIDATFVRVMSVPLFKMLLYVTDKVLDKIQQLKDKVANIPRKSEEEELADWFNLLGRAMAAHTKINETLDKGPLQSQRLDCPETGHCIV